MAVRRDLGHSKLRRRPNSSFITKSSLSEPSIPTHTTTRAWTRIRNVHQWLNQPIQLYKFHDIPHYLQDNEFIFTGYRAFYSWSECARSALHWHNESINIWTHLMGAGAFLTILTCFLDSHPQANVLDRTVMAIYHLSAFTCLACSGIFHLFHCHNSRKIYDCAAITDYTGISALLFGSFSALVYFAFRPHPTLIVVPMATTLLASLAGVVLPWLSFFRSHKYRTLRTLIFITFSSSIILTVGWAASIVWHEVVDAWEWNWVVCASGSVLSYALGAVIYALKIPESIFPGKFDLIGSSHQLWHVAVIIGAVSHWQLLVILQNWRLIQEQTF